MKRDPGRLHGHWTLDKELISHKLATVEALFHLLVEGEISLLLQLI